MDAESWKALLSTIATILGAILVATPGIWALIQQRHKINADTMETLQDTLDKAAAMNEKLQARMDAVEQRTVILLADNRAKGDRLTELERANRQVIAENKRLEKYVKMLIAEVRRCGGTVPEMPALETDEVR